MLLWQYTVELIYFWPAGTALLLAVSYSSELSISWRG